MPSGLLDLVGAFQSGVASRATVDQIQASQQRQRMLEDATDQKAKVMQARQMYAAGDPSALAALDPEGYGKIREQEAKVGQARAQMQKAQTDEAIAAENAQKAQAIGRAKFIEHAATLAKQNPDAWPQLREMVDSMIPELKGKLGDQPPSTDVLDEQIVGARTMQALLGDQKYSDRIQKVAEILGVPPGMALNDPRAGKMLEEMNRADLQGKTTPRTTVNVQTGVSPLEKSARGKLQSDIIDQQEMLDTLNDIKATTRPEFLGAEGKLKGAIGKVADQFGLVSSGGGFGAYIKDRSRWKAEVEQLFQGWRKYITGAAAAEKEIKDLKESFITSDLGQVEFEGRMEQIQGKINRAIRLKRKILAEGGINTKEELTEKLDAAWDSGDDGLGAITKDGQRIQMGKLRAQQLAAAGKSLPEQFAALVLEGYMTQEQADAALINLK